ncbi:C-type lectin domain family 2 member D-like [Hemicordylus capensis]|uniref:C-type lectin domain family 2 member D-like n=1 Tax=Hemicordylus capensis TaxID=884348 RepID=UPI00230222A4|nr:C-type lectin domain family 2 member D-like [Hemicordylus capensis]
MRIAKSKKPHSIVLVRKPSHDVAAHRGPPCPRYWNWYEGNCYYFSKEEKDWSSSQKFCAAHNASLARIESEDMDFVMKYKGKSSYWIGLRREKGQPWKWINGDNSVLQVIGDGGNCAYLNDEGEATASSSMCNIEHLWLCRKSDASASSSVI